VLAYRRTLGEESILCIFNLSPQPVKVTVGGDAELLMGQDAERGRTRLTLGGSSFAFFAEAPGGRLDLRFNRRARKPAAQ
jgi:alpha-glucosidase